MDPQLTPVDVTLVDSPLDQYLQGHAELQGAYKQIEWKTKDDMYSKEHTDRKNRNSRPKKSGIRDCGGAFVQEWLRECVLRGWVWADDLDRVRVQKSQNTIENSGKSGKIGEFVARMARIWDNSGYGMQMMGVFSVFNFKLILQPVLLMGKQNSQNSYSCDWVQESATFDKESRALIAKLQEYALTHLGYGLTVPLPPISRLESSERHRRAHVAQGMLALHVLNARVMLCRVFKELLQWLGSKSKGVERERGGEGISDEIEVTLDAIKKARLEYWKMRSAFLCAPGTNPSLLSAFGRKLSDFRESLESCRKHLVWRLPEDDVFSSSSTNDGSVVAQLQQYVKGIWIQLQWLQDYSMTELQPQATQKALVREKILQLAESVSLHARILLQTIQNKPLSTVNAGKGEENKPNEDSSSVNININIPVPTHVVNHDPVQKGPSLFVAYKGWSDSDDDSMCSGFSFSSLDEEGPELESKSSRASWSKRKDDPDVIQARKQAAEWFLESANEAVEVCLRVRNDHDDDEANAFVLPDVEKEMEQASLQPQPHAVGRLLVDELQLALENRH